VGRFPHRPRSHGIPKLHCKELPRCADRVGTKHSSHSCTSAEPVKPFNCRTKAPRQRQTNHNQIKVHRLCQTRMHLIHGRT
jgi:hypothetical protein